MHTRCEVLTKTWKTFISNETRHFALSESGKVRVIRRKGLVASRVSLASSNVTCARSQLERPARPQLTSSICLRHRFGRPLCAKQDGTRPGGGAFATVVCYRKNWQKLQRSWICKGWNKVAKRAATISTNSKLQSQKKNSKPRLEQEVRREKARQE